MTQKGKLTFTLGLIGGFVLFLGLFLLTKEMRVRAEPATAPTTPAIALKPMNTLGLITITQPTTGTVLTTTAGATVAVLGKYEFPGTLCLSQSISVTTDGGNNYYTATTSISCSGTFTYAWSLPDEDNITHTIIARTYDRYNHQAVTDAVKVVVDRVAPTATVPTAPRWPATTTVPISWAAGTDGAGVAGYTLWISGSDGTTATLQVTTTAARFTAANEGVTYRARLRARDAHGNRGTYGNRSAPFTPDLTPPTVILTVPTSFTVGGPLTVSWSADDATSGIATFALRYRAGNTATWTTTVTGTTASSGTFAISPTKNITYYLVLTGTDHAGRRKTAMANAHPIIIRPTHHIVYLPLTLRSYPPIPQGNVSVIGTYEVTVTINLSATVLNDTVQEMRLKYDNNNWGDWQKFVTETTHTFNQSGRHTVWAQFRGEQGGLSAPASDSTYLTLNGNFENGWTHWRKGAGQFNGHGSGLSNHVMWEEEEEETGSFALVLGSLDYRDGSIPIGYTYVSRTLEIPSEGSYYLVIEYRVISWDLVKSSGKYWDSFEVSLNRSPSEVTNNERDTRCKNNQLNPSGYLSRSNVPSNGGLVFCGGGASTGGKDDTKWKTVKLDLSGYAGNNVTLYLAIWSREYNPPYYNDQGYYNTYAYVDNVHLEQQK